jgi:hypothetical protein
MILASFTVLALDLNPQSQGEISTLYESSVRHKGAKAYDGNVPNSDGWLYYYI